MKGFKVFDPDWTCRGFKYEVGQAYVHNGEIAPCHSGFHFCAAPADCFDYYKFDPNNKVAEVEAVGQTIVDGNKTVTDHIMIVREIPWAELLVLVNQGKDNTGLCNTGDRNTGNWNTGNRNTGDWNTGDCNTGNRNTGNRNTGDWNTGNRNTGNRNTGDWNTGNWNTGDWNTGFANLCDFESGAFNTIPGNIRIFNKEFPMSARDFYNSEYYDAFRDGGFNLTEWISAYRMTDEEKAANPSWETTEGYLKRIDYKEAWADNWANKSETNKNIILTMPGFDAAIFFEVTGIDTTK